MDSKDLNLLGAVTPVIQQLQSFLTDMRREHREDLQRISDKLDKFDARLDEHDRRIVVVENTRESLRWLVKAGFGFAISGFLDLAFNHVPKWVHLLK